MQKYINILVDADSIFFKLAYNNKKTDLKRSYRKFCKEMELNIINNIDPFHEDWNIRYAVKGTGNFRKDIFPEYKSKRPELDEEIREKLNYLWKYSIDQGAVQADGMEADDLVSIWAFDARKLDENYIIAGIDKDLKQIPGNHYNYAKGTFSFVDDDTARYNLMIQALTGDNTDGIPGLKGIGPKKAEKILKDIKPSKMFTKVLETWKEHGHTEDECVMSLRLLTMLTTFEELENVKQKYLKPQVQDETVQCEQHDIQEQSN